MATMTAPAASRIRSIDAVADARWDAYVRSHPDATAYHLAGWMSILSGAYRYRPASLAIEEGGRLRGVLPLMGQRRPLSGPRLRSLPAVHTAGPLADTPELAVALVEAAFDLGKSHGLLVNVDTRLAGLDALSPRLRVEPKPPSWIMQVPDDPDPWLRGRSQNLRRGVKRAEKAGVTMREAGDEETLVAWHRLYLGTMRRHRSMPRPLRQLELARRELPPGVFRLFVAEREGQLLAGGVWHVFNGTIELLYNASDESAWDVRPNHALYSQVIRWAAEQGLPRLDFGFAPPGEPLGNFKASWGAEPVAEQRYVDATGPAPPVDASMNAAEVGREERGRRDVLLSRLWHRTYQTWGRAPLPATHAVGALVYRYL